MNYETALKNVELHRRAINGKKKFIDYFLNGDLQRNIIPSNDNMACRFYGTPLGDITEYVTLCTPAFGTNHIQHAIETGEIPLKVRLGYHLLGAGEGSEYWYYNATKSIDARKIPARIYDYLVRKLQYSDPGHHILGTHARTYSVLVDSYDDVLEIIRNDYQYRSELPFYEHSDGKLHPRGDLVRFITDYNPNVTLQYDDFYPELTEDKFFNMQLQGIPELDILVQLRKIQYSASIEIRARMGAEFCTRCDNIF